MAPGLMPGVFFDLVIRQAKGECWWQRGFFRKFL